jgi:hypothetical protein
VSEKLLRGHGEPYLPVIIVDRLTVVPCTADGKNHCTGGGGCWEHPKGWQSRTILRVPYMLYSRS